jgi:hypothetical protein
MMALLFIDGSDCLETEDGSKEWFDAAQRDWPTAVPKQIIAVCIPEGAYVVEVVNDQGAVVGQVSCEADAFLVRVRRR